MVGLNSAGLHVALPELVKNSHERVEDWASLGDLYRGEIKGLDFGPITYAISSFQTPTSCYKVLALSGPKKGFTFYVGRGNLGAKVEVG